jgi:endonuclease YncB( thermonuclease family)
MNQYVIIAIIAIAIFLIWIASTQNVEPFTVISSHDGDTTTVRDRNGNQFKIRYAAIDANELGQAGGKEARDYLYSLIPVDSKVSIVFTGNESYGRYEATIYRNGKNISLAMLQAGHAVIDTRYIKRIELDMRADYQKAQDNAKKNKLGRWSSRKTQQMPSEWRKK